MPRQEPSPSSFIDITRPIHVGMKVWPGDTDFEHQWTSSISSGQVSNTSAIRLSTHTGTHTDSPLHVRVGGRSVDKLPIDSLIGQAMIVEVRNSDQVGVRHLENIDFNQTRRILFKTRGSSRKNTEWTNNFVSIEKSAAEYLVSKKTLLVGMDSPSVDPFDSLELPSHKILTEEGVVILENLFLQDVAPGFYELIALPLKLQNLDGSPIRAVLKILK